MASGRSLPRCFSSCGGRWHLVRWPMIFAELRSDRHMFGAWKARGQDAVPKSSQIDFRRSRTKSLPGCPRKVGRENWLSIMKLKVHQIHQKAQLQLLQACLGPVSQMHRAVRSFSLLRIQRTCGKKGAFLFGLVPIRSIDMCFELVSELIFVWRAIVVHHVIGSFDVQSGVTLPSSLQPTSTNQKGSSSSLQSFQTDQSEPIKTSLHNLRLMLHTWQILINKPTFQCFIISW